MILEREREREKKKMKKKKKRENVWEGGEKIGGNWVFSPQVHQNSISPNWGDYKRENKMFLVAFEQIYPSSRYILDVWGMGSIVVGLLWTFWSFWLLFFWRFSSPSFFGECSYVSFLMFWLVFVFCFFLSFGLISYSFLFYFFSL